MKLPALVIFVVLVLLSTKIKSYGDTTVDISNSGSGSESQVSIHNTMQSSSTINSISQSHTSIHMETNGQVQNYDSNNSGDGKNTLDSNSTLITPTIPTIILPSITPPTVTSDLKKINDKVNAIRAKIQEKKKNTQGEQEGFLQKLQLFLKPLFSFHVSL